MWGYDQTHTKTDWHSEFDSELESASSFCSNFAFCEGVYLLERGTGRIIELCFCK